MTTSMSSGTRWAIFWSAVAVSAVALSIFRNDEYTTPPSTSPPGNGTMIIRPVIRNVPSMLPNNQFINLRGSFLLLPPEIKGTSQASAKAERSVLNNTATIYSHFWARSPQQPGHRHAGFALLDSGHNTISPGSVPARRQLWFDRQMLYMPKDIVDSFYDELLSQLLPLKLEFIDSAALVRNQQGLVIEEVR